MSSKWLVLAVVLGALVVVGCDSGSSSPPPKAGAAAGNTAQADKDAQALIDQVNAAIKDKKWDNADAAMKKLDASKAQLSDAMKKQVDELKKALDVAKTAAGGVTAPKVDLPK
jgi:cysteinyl-tRNA synthetase